MARAVYCAPLLLLACRRDVDEVLPAGPTEVVDLVTPLAWQPVSAGRDGRGRTGASARRGAARRAGAVGEDDRHPGQGERLHDRSHGDFSAPAGTPIYFHVHNHGQNNWTFAWARVQVPK